MLTVSEIAANRIIQQAAKTGRPAEIIIDVKPSGCSGLEYKIEWAKDNNIRPEFLSINAIGAKVYVTPAACNVLYGATMIVKKEGLNEGFDFDNPNEIDSCGCGKSFRV